MENLETEFQNREEPVVLKPGEVCKFTPVCPYSQPNCYGSNGQRDWIFVCDIKKLKEIKS